MASDHPRESPEGVIRLSSPRKHGSDVRIEGHDDAAFGVTCGVLVRPSPAKVVLRKDFIAAASTSCDLVSSPRADQPDCLSVLGEHYHEEPAAVASSNETLCLARLSAALRGFHSNASGPGNYPRPSRKSIAVRRTEAG